MVNFQLRIAVLLVSFAIGLASPTRAHIVTEEPWHPAAAAYRSMMFFADLVPVNWGLIRQVYERKHAASRISRPGKSYIDARAGKMGAAIDRAIADKDRQALFAAATRAMSQLIRRSLDDAGKALSTPGKAQQAVLEAQALYRSFADVIAQADSAGNKRIGLAWLELTNSLGSTGVSGKGAVAADKATFATARKAIEAYLVANYEPEKFSRRTQLAPVPESIVAKGGSIQLAAKLPPGSNINDQVPLPRLVLNFEERGIDEKDLPLIAYGDMLFDSPMIFGGAARALGISCATCHNRSDINQAFFIPGISHRKGAADVDGSYFNALFNDHRADGLDIPSLRGIRFLGPYGRDGRFGSLRTFVRNVIVNEFAGPEPTPFMLDAIMGYMLEFDFLPNSKIDRQGRLTAKASTAARRGERLFNKPFAQMDGKACATCHIPSANFIDRRSHDIGSAHAAYKGARASAFDTPTLLGLRFTAPYFHDGALPTLASVVAWFDTRHKLKLSAAERGDLTAYLEAVGDADEPYETFAGKKTKFRLGWEELTTFASTFAMLLPKRDAYHAKLMLETVARDLAVDASGMINLRAKPKVYELAGLLTDMRKAVSADDWAKAGKLWTSFQDLQVKYDKEMY